MIIAVTGSSGLVGSALRPALAAAGHRVVRLVHGASAPGPGSAAWDPAAGRLDPAALEGVEAVVHLAGEGIATGRWTAATKARIRDSRVRGTTLLAERLAAMARPPQVLICASAVGWYGDRGDERLTEASGPGRGFLAETGQAWEAACGPAAQRGIRVVSLRCGMILSPSGGGLATMLPIFRWGLGGPLGSGRQFLSWIALDDVVGVIQFALATERLRGPVNTVAPQSLTNREFTAVLGRVLRRPAICQAPAFALRLALGEMAQGLLLASARVVPARLLEAGYPFRFPDAEGALRHLLGRPGPR